MSGELLRLARAGVGFLFQTTCFGCGRIAEGRPLCRGCESWDSAAVARLPTGESALADLRSAYWLTELAKTLVHAVKYGRHLSALSLVPFPPAETLLAAFGPVEAIVPVPLHPAKWVERGFNQADWLAARLGRELGVPVRHPLEKTLATVSQSTLGRRAREKNLKAAFRWSGAPFRSVLLVDDIFTTGATLEACAGAARAAGVERRLAWTLFRTPRGK